MSGSSASRIAKVMSVGRTRRPGAVALAVAALLTSAVTATVTVAPAAAGVGTGQRVFSGTVTAPGGSLPVAGAIVHAVRKGGFLDVATPVLTQSDGTFSITVFDTPTTSNGVLLDVDIEVVPPPSAPNAANARRTFSTDTNTADFALPAAQVYVNVSADTGTVTPQVGAIARLWDQMGNMKAAFTNSAGRAGFAGLAGTKYDVDAVPAVNSDNRLMTTMGQQVVIDPMAITPSMTAVTQAMGDITGRVVGWTWQQTDQRTFVNDSLRVSLLLRSPHSGGQSCASQHSNPAAVRADGSFAIACTVDVYDANGNPAGSMADTGTMTLVAYPAPMDNSSAPSRFILLDKGTGPLDVTSFTGKPVQLQQANFVGVLQATGRPTIGMPDMTLVNKVDGKFAAVAFGPSLHGPWPFRARVDTSTVYNVEIGGQFPTFGNMRPDTLQVTTPSVISAQSPFSETITLPAPTAVVKVVRPAAGPSFVPVEGNWVRVQVSGKNQDGTPSGFFDVDSTFTAGSQEASMGLAETGTASFWISSQVFDPNTQTVVTPAFVRFSADVNQAPPVLSPEFAWPESATMLQSPVVITLPANNVTGLITDAVGQPANNVDVQLLTWQTKDNKTGWMPVLGGEGMTGPDGTFGLSVSIPDSTDVKVLLRPRSGPLGDTSTVIQMASPLVIDRQLSDANLIVQVANPTSSPLQPWDVNIDVEWRASDTEPWLWIGNTPTRNDDPSVAKFSVPAVGWVRVGVSPNTQALWDAFSPSSTVQQLAGTTVVPVSLQTGGGGGGGKGGNGPTLQLRYANSDTATGVLVDIAQWQGGGWGQWPNGTQSDGNGNAVLPAMNSGWYRFDLVPPASSGAGATYVVVNVQNDGGNWSMTSCPQNAFIGTGCNPDSSTVSKTGNGSFNFTVGAATLAYEVKVGDAPAAGALVRLERWDSNLGSGSFDWSARPLISDGQGVVRYAVETGIYRGTVEFVVQVGDETANSSFTFIDSVTVTGSGTTVLRGGVNGFDYATATLNGASPLDPVAGLFPVIVQPSNSVWQVVFGGAVSGAGLNLRPYVTFGQGGGYFAQGAEGARSNAHGLAGLAFDASGTFPKVYQLEVKPPDGSSAITTYYVLQVDTVTAAGAVELRLCADLMPGMNGQCTNFQPLETATAAGTTVNVAKLDGPNFYGILCEPGAGSCVSVGNARIDVSRKQSDSMGNSWWSYTNGTNSIGWGTDIGTFNLAFTDGDYQLQVRQPYMSMPATASTWSDTVFYIRVSGGGTQFEWCTGGGSDPCSQRSPLTQSASQRVQFRYKAANVNGKVVSSSDTSTGIPYTYVEVRVPNGQCEGCSDYLTGTGTNATGTFSINLDDGSYIFAVNPGGSTSGNVVRTEFAVSMKGGAVDTATLPANAVLVDSVLQLRLAAANVVGKVVMGGAVVQWAGINVNVKDGDNLTWYPAWGNTDFNGRFSLSLPDGSYQLRVQPSAMAGTSAAGVSVNITVKGSAVHCAVLDDKCAEDVDGLVISLSAPNVHGRVLGAGAEPLSWQWIQVDKFEPAFRSYTWSPDVSGASSDYSGNYALSLPDGRWRLTVYPNDSSLTKKSVELWVLGSTVCRMPISDTGCADTVTAGVLDIQLTGGNVSGTVYKNKAGNVKANQGGVNVEKYDPMFGNWQWIDAWANVNWTGGYSLNLTDPGTYRLTVNPPWDDTTYSRTYAFVVVDASSKVCMATDEGGAKAGACAVGETLTASATVDVELKSANVKGTVIANGQGLRNVWVAVQQWNATYRYWEYVNGASTNDSGAFAVNLDTAGTYRLEVNPPWNNDSGLTRKTVTLTVPDSLMVDPLSITLNAGNLTGQVLDKDGIPVAWTGIQVDKWTVAPWDERQYTWQWADLPLNTNATGSFTANIEASQSGVYRFTAYPSGDMVGQSKVTKLVGISVAEDGALTWCSYVESKLNNSDSATPFGPCTPGSGGIQLRLSGANVLGTLQLSQADTSTVRDAWVGIVRTKDGAGNWLWEWNGGSPVSFDGKFSATLTEDGTYRFEFNPPWQGVGASLSRFATTVVVSNCSTACSATVDTGTGTASGSLASTLNWTVWFPSANINGTVCDAYASGCTAVPNAGLAIFLVDDVSDQWTDFGGGTDRSGTFKMAIPDGTYRFEVNPAWDNPRGLRMTYWVRVCGTGYELFGTREQLLASAATCSQSGSLDLKLGKPNVSGTVKSGATNVGWAWVEAVDATSGNWLSGGNADASGAFSLSLPDGTYVLRVYPNGDVQAMPMQVAVSVSGGSAGTMFYCAYMGQTDCGVADTVTANVIDLAHQAPNVTIASDLVGKHYIAVFKCGQTAVADCTDTDWMLDRTFTVVTDAAGGATLTLANGNWRLQAVPNAGENLATYVQVITVGNGVANPASITWTAPK